MEIIIRVLLLLLVASFCRWSSIQASSEASSLPSIEWVECQLIQVDVDYLDQVDGASNEKEVEEDDDEDFVCLTDDVDGQDAVYSLDIDLDDHDIDWSSSPMISISHVYVDRANSKLIVADHARIDVRHSSTRRLAPQQGTSTVLVLRVTYQEASPILSVKQLAGRIFGLGDDDVAESVNLVSQFQACSFGKLKMVPAQGNGITDGVANIVIDEHVSGDYSVRNLENLVVDEANRRFGTLSLLFEHVIVVMPNAGLKLHGRDYLAYGLMNGYRTVFHDEWAGRLSALAHEVGHNLNLGHSGKGSQLYADVTGYMGYGSSEVGGPATCFNAHKHWILGWFKDRSLALTTNDLPWTGELAAFADYDVTPSSQYTIIRIGQSGPARLFLQYNLAKKMNRGARAFKNMVVVTEDEGSNPGYQSWAVGSINVDLNGSLKYSGLYDLDHDLVIEVCEKGSGPTDFVRLSVYVDDGKQQSGCSKLPKSSGEECVDSAADVFVEQKGVYRNCGWLSRNFDKWGPVLCVPGQEAHALCPATCGTCSLQSCMDSSDTFYANSNNGYQDCTWLAKREARIDRFCYEGHEAYETCPATCNSCS